MLVSDMLLYPEEIEEEEGLSGRRSRARRARRRRRRAARRSRRRRRKVARRTRRARRKGRVPSPPAAVTAEREAEAQQDANAGAMTADTPDVPVAPTGIMATLWPADQPIHKRPAVWAVGGILVLAGLVAATKGDK